MKGLDKLRQIAQPGPVIPAMSRSEAAEVLGKIAFLEQELASVRHALDIAHREVGRLTLSRAEVCKELAAEHGKHDQQRITGGV